MANYVRQTWIDGNPANPTSAARMGVIENGIFDAHFQPAVRVIHNAAQSVTSAVSLTLAFNTEFFDTDTIHDTVTNNTRLTCKTAGKYWIFGSAEFASAAGNIRAISIQLNATTTLVDDRRAPLGGGFVTQVNVGTEYDLAVNDFVELQVFQDSGGAINVNSSTPRTPVFGMFRVA